MPSGIYQRTEEHKRKISKSLKGQRRSAETIEKMIESKKGHLVSTIVRNNISNSLRKHFEVNPMSEETKIKMSKRRIGINNPMFGVHLIGWSKGLTKETDERIKKSGEKRKGQIMSEASKEKIRNARAKQITPIKDTSIEVKIQNYLKELQIDFFTHQHIKIEHGYQCDIFIPSKNLVIECDGDYWHSYPTGKGIDHIRTLELIAKGFKVLRLWEHEIKVMQLNDFKNKIECIK